MIHIDYDPQRYDPVNYLTEPDLDAETLALLEELEVPIEDLDLGLYDDES